MRFYMSYRSELITMNSCEYCMLPEDLDDFSSRNLYVVSLGFVFDSRPRVEEVVAVPKSKLERYKRGDYEWQVIEAEQLSSHNSDVDEAIQRMCAKYGKVHITKNPVNMSHEERVKVANEVAGKLITRPYVKSVYLTGSTALRLDRNNSDIDLLVVLGYCTGNNGHAEIEKLGEGYSGAVEFFYIQQRDFLGVQSLQYPLIRDRSLIVSK